MSYRYNTMMIFTVIIYKSFYWATRIPKTATKNLNIWGSQMRWKHSEIFTTSIMKRTLDIISDPAVIFPSHTGTIIIPDWHAGLGKRNHRQTNLWDVAAVQVHQAGIQAEDCWKWSTLRVPWVSVRVAAAVEGRGNWGWDGEVTSKQRFHVGIPCTRLHHL